MKVHFVKKSEDSYVMFMCESLTFYNINSKTKHIVEDILSGVRKDIIIDRYSISGRDYESIKNIVYFDVCDNITAESDSILYKLVLNVTNKCNLGCKYCYANGGCYHSTEHLMDIDIAKEAIECFYSKYKYIKFIQFFGGEPLLNVSVIEYVCQYITEMYENNKIEFLPMFGIVTNGTIYTEKIGELINKYKIIVTVSIDGKKEIHDFLRIYKDGSGTYEIVSNTINKLSDKSRYPVNMEVTYTNTHERAGDSVLDTVKFLKHNFKESNIHIVPVSGSEKFMLKNRESFRESVDKIFEELRKNKNDYSYSLVNRIINALKKRKSNCYLCEAGISIFSVACDGNVYPCFMFTDVEEFRMGNVREQNTLFENVLFKKIKDDLKKFNKFTNKKCSQCFNNRLCSGCLGINYFECGDIHTTSDMDCDMYRALTEKVLINLSNIS